VSVRAWVVGGPGHCKGEKGEGLICIGAVYRNSIADLGLNCRLLKGVFVKMPTCAGFPIAGRFRVRAAPRVGRVGPELVYLFRREIAIAFDFSSKLNFGN